MMTDSKYTFVTHTFGCKVNTYDSGLLQKTLESHGFVSVSKSALNHSQEIGSPLNSKSDVERKPHVHLLNSCAVTAEASKEALRVARKIKSKEPFAKVVLTGCAAQVDTEMFVNAPAIDLVVANSHKSMIPFLIDDLFKGKIEQKVHKSNIFKKESLEEGGGLEESHTRSFLKIQDGCNSFCTYCVIPFARGKSRSLSIQHLVHRVQELYTKGFREIVLTGVHIGDYEDEVLGQKKALEDLVEALLLKTKMPRFRLSSLEPVEVTPRLLELYSDGRMCPHFHMSIQSAETQVLSDMKRKYSSEDVRMSLERIQEKVPGAYVGMDVIVGFPTESQDQFSSTYELLASTPWTRIHVFPYSERPGTRAAKFEVSVRPEERARRADRLRELSLERQNSWAQAQIGTVKSVLTLKSKKLGGEIPTLSRDYWNVHLPFREELSAQSEEIQVRVEKAEMNSRGEFILKGREVHG